jgi:peptidoglycan/LPS O-acetylase OafA/YrhL
LVPVFVVLAACQGNHPSIHRTALLFLINTCIALCIDWAITHRESGVGRALNSRPMTAIGVLSYSIYLWQQPFTHLRNQDPIIPLAGFWQILSNPLVSLLCIFTCTGLSYFLIERPSLRFRERIETYSGERRPGADSTKISELAVK